MARFKSRKSRRGRRTRKYRARRNKKTVINRSIVNLGQGLPKKIMVTHRYRESFPVTSTTGGIGNYLFSCNGLYDPNTTGSGHQPMYYDQFSALYDQYTVIGSRITYLIVPSTSSTVPVKIGVFINDDTTSTPTSVDNISELPSGKMYILPQNSTKTLVIRKNWSAKKTFGGSVLGNDSLQGTISTNPSEQSYYQISMQSIDSFSTCTIFVQALVEYIVIWDELRDIAGS